MHHHPRRWPGGTSGGPKFPAIPTPTLLSRGRNPTTTSSLASLPGDGTTERRCDNVVRNHRNRQSPPTPPRSRESPIAIGRLTNSPSQARHGNLAEVREYALSLRSAPISPPDS